MKKKNSILICSGIIGGIALIGIVAFLGVRVFNELRKLDIVETTEVSEYVNELSNIHVDDTGSNFVLYPKTGLEDMDIQRCFYRSEVGLVDTYYQMYMECKFTEEDYKEEVSRIEAIEIKHDGKVHSPFFSEELFSKPAYVAIYEKYDYEYVLLDEENYTIVYVFNRIEDLSLGNIPKEYLPIHYDTADMPMTEEYNMYYFDGAKY